MEDQNTALVPTIKEEWTQDQVALIKSTVARGATDDELKLYLYTAQRMGLDPLAKQIHAVKRWSAEEQRKTMAIQVGIDGLRLVADRTGKYAPGQTTVYEVENGNLVAATAYVKKLVAGAWHEFGETAYYQEYVARKKDGKPNRMWTQFPRVMLAKCAEARALRRAFPAELSGVYTGEEMDQAGEVIDVTPKEETTPPPPKEEKKQPPAPKPNPQEKADKESSPIVQLWIQAEKANVPADEWKLWCKEFAITKDKRTQGKKKMEQLEKKIEEWKANSRDTSDEKMFISDDELSWLRSTAEASSLDIGNDEGLLAFCRETIGNDDVKLNTLTKDEFDQVMTALNEQGGES